VGPLSDVLVRTEEPADHEEVARVVATAFRSEPHARLVEALRTSPGFVPSLSLVAVEDGQVVGHVMISLVGLVGPEGSEQEEVPCLSPLAVDPATQRRGIGSALVRAVTAAAADRGEDLVVLEGDPAYYGRLGFEPAAPHGIEIDLPSWAPPEAAQVLRLRPDRPLPTGRVVYPAPFALVTED
jgi:putative acetyltransferase